MPTTIRIALLAGILALLSNLAVIGFIYWRTHDEAVATVRRQVLEQGKVLTDVYRSGAGSQSGTPLKTRSIMPIRKPLSRCSIATAGNSSAISPRCLAGRRSCARATAMP